MLVKCLWLIQEKPSRINLPIYSFNKCFLDLWCISATEEGNRFISTCCRAAVSDKLGSYADSRGKLRPLWWGLVGCNYFPIGNFDVLPWKAADGNYFPLDVCIYCGTVSVLSAPGVAGALLNGLTDMLTSSRTATVAGVCWGSAWMLPQSMTSRDRRYPCGWGSVPGSKSSTVEQSMGKLKQEEPFPVDGDSLSPRVCSCWPPY